MSMHEAPGYVVPTYQAPPNADWYHFLHGNVPGHQIDFIFRPDVPQGALTRQHFSHLARLVKYIEPRLSSSYAFAIGNLSRDDTQYEPGHGGIGFIFGLRIKGAVDHAGRQDPPFCHAVACVDRQLDTPSIFEASVRFHEHLLFNTHAPTHGTRWYQSYVAFAQAAPLASVVAEMQAYVQAFDRLPLLQPSDLGLRWTIEGSHAPRRVVIVHPDQTSFTTLAQHAARIASVLVESDIRWTAITTGREQDLLGGTTVRFVPEREAMQEPEDVVLMHIDQVPVEPRDIAQQLFGAHAVRLSVTNQLRLRWRHMGQQAQAAVPDPGLARPWAAAEEQADKPAEIEPAAESSDGLTRPHVEAEAKKKRRNGQMILIAAAMAVMVLGLAGLVMVAMHPVRIVEPAMRRPAASVLPVVESAEPVVSAAPPPVEPSAAPVAVPSASATGNTAPKTRKPRPNTVSPAGTGKPKGGTVLGGKLR